MKITLYTPDGTTATYRDCSINYGPHDDGIYESRITGKDIWNNLVTFSTTLPCFICHDVTQEAVLEKFDGTLVAGLMDLVDETVTKQ